MAGEIGNSLPPLWKRRRPNAASGLRESTSDKNAADPPDMGKPAASVIKTLALPFRENQRLCVKRKAPAAPQRETPARTFTLVTTKKRRCVQVLIVQFSCPNAARLPPLVHDLPSQSLRSNGCCSPHGVAAALVTSLRSQCRPQRVLPQFLQNCHLTGTGLYGAATRLHRTQDSIVLPVSALRSCGMLAVIQYSAALVVLSIAAPNFVRRGKTCRQARRYLCQGKSIGDGVLPRFFVCQVRPDHAAAHSLIERSGIIILRDTVTDE